MKYKIVSLPLNSLPVVDEVDLDDLSAVATSLNGELGDHFPIIVFSVDSGEAYRVTRGDDGYFLSDDADELIGPATTAEEFKRVF